MDRNTNGRLSMVTLLLCCLLMVVTSFVYYPRWQQKGSEATISYDVSGYYWYLPSLFIYHDIKGQGFKDSILAKYAPTPEFQQGYRLPNGNYVLKYSAGMAVMYLPFFAIAHVMAPLLGFPADGFSVPYALGIQLGGLLVAFLGLFYFRRLLLCYFKDKVVAVVLAMLVVGTNYLDFSTMDVGMSHSWLFTLYVLLLWHTRRWYQDFKLRDAVAIGLLVGLATLTRPTEIICGLVPVLWGVASFSRAAIMVQFSLLWQQRHQLAVAALCAIGMLSIQLCYWKYVSGHWLVYSYQEQHLNLKTPHLFDYALHYRSGWLLYTPVLWLALAGIPLYWRRGKHVVAVVAFLLLNYYLVSAWSVWWYGGRAMVQSYPVLLLPLAVLAEWVMERRKMLVLFVPAVLLGCYLNIWAIHQGHRGRVFMGGYVVNKAYYWHVVGCWDYDPYSVVLMDKADIYNGPLPANPSVLACFPIGQDTAARVWDGVYEVPLEKNHGDWINVEVAMDCPWYTEDELKMAQVELELSDEHGSVKRNFLRLERLLVARYAGPVHLLMNTHGLHFIQARVWFKNNGTGNITLKQLKVSSF